MNKEKELIICSILVILIAILVAFNFFAENNYKVNGAYNSPKQIYQVYLDGEKVGLIDSKEELYNLINKEQVEIKQEYNVEQVHPPKGFQIIKTNTYNEEVSTVEDVYNKIKNIKEFTVKGYTISIKSPDTGVEHIYIYVIDDDIFISALNNVVEAFIGGERYEQFKTNTQPEIADTGYTIDSMYFKETITIRESYISVNEKIYTDENELTQYLLFGENNSFEEYVVNQGDTIEKIAENNKLNTSELLIANNELKSVDTLLAIGQKLNVALINPVLDLVYKETVIEDVEEYFQKVYEEDNTKYIDYRATKTLGSNGIHRVTSIVEFTNGEQNQGAIRVDSKVIKPVQNEIIIKGTKQYAASPGTVYVDTGAAWAWPTNSPYIITSPYGYRWGTIHNGLDISGTGYGSPIYASLDGIVVSSQYGGMVGSSAGYNVVIEHYNGYYTVYAHCSALYVKVGEHVSRGQRIAAMGASGNVTGTHLHFGVYIGKPYAGGVHFNPLKLWQ